jgi:hypothetical protein
MRTFAARPDLPEQTLLRLQEKTDEIVVHPDPRARADTIYTSARSTVWFSPVIAALRQMAGIGERCMLCSGSESSTVEHFQPKAVFPLVAMSWDNFLWSCGICNGNKGDRFPLGVDKRLINPIEENVWEFFFIDEYGNLSEIWRTELQDFDPRAQSTLATLGLGRDALQQTRQSRLRNLKHLINGALSAFDCGEISTADLRARIQEWIEEPFQPDVADFFLRGPGATEDPFAQVLAKASSNAAQHCLPALHADQSSPPQPHAASESNSPIVEECLAANSA